MLYSRAILQARSSNFNSKSQLPHFSSIPLNYKLPKSVFHKVPDERNKTHTCIHPHLHTRSNNNDNNTKVATVRPSLRHRHPRRS